MNSPPTKDEAQAAQRYTIINLVRIGSVICLGLGMAIVREVISVPYWLGVMFVIIGVGLFFFAPPMLAKKWKANDAEAGGRER